MKILKVLKNVVFSLLFLALLFGIILTLGYKIRPYEDEDGWNWIYYYQEPENSIDVVALGSSAMYRFWIPPEMYEQKGYTSALIATPGQDIHLVPYFMEEAAKTQNPQLFVVEVRNIVSYGTYDRKDIDISDRIEYNRVLATMSMKPSLTRFSMINCIMKDKDIQTWMEWQMPLLKYHETILNMTKEEYEERKEKRTVEYKFARQLSRIESFEDGEFVDTKHYSLTEDEKYCIDAIMEKSEELGIPVLLISTPFIPEQEEKISLQKTLSAYIKEKGYPYIDFTEKVDELGLDYRVDFYDKNHTNIHGAQKVNSYLADYIMDHYKIKTKHNLREKWDWTQACKAWNSYADKLLAHWEYRAKSILGQ